MKKHESKYIMIKIDDYNMYCNSYLNNLSSHHSAIAILQTGYIK